MSRLASASLLIASVVALAGCGTTGPIGSVTGGECQLVRAPEYAVRGETTFDQIWINRTTEALVVGCRQPRPKARPPSLTPELRARVVSLDPELKAAARTLTPKQKRQVVAVAKKEAAKIVPAKKRAGFIKRLRAYYGI